MSSSVLPAARRLRIRTRFCAVTPSSSVLTVRMRAVPSCLPRTIEKMTVPTGPGVRWDSGFVAGDVIGGNFDSMLAKLIVTGADREQALQRARRALAELTIEGMPTVIPFHRVVLNDPLSRRLRAAISRCTPAGLRPVQQHRPHVLWCTR